jgi:LPS-assembly protein
VASATERQLLRELRTDYRTEDWSLTARVQNYQVCRCRHGPEPCS